MDDVRSFGGRSHRGTASRVGDQSTTDNSQPVPPGEWPDEPVQVEFTDIGEPMAAGTHWLIVTNPDEVSPIALLYAADSTGCVSANIDEWTKWPGGGQNLGAPFACKVMMA